MTENNKASPCIGCGLCCDGTLWDYVFFEEDEREKLLQLGFSLYEQDSELRFDQPCSKCIDGGCSVYAERPKRCRRYSCETLKQYEANEIGFGEAQRRVKIAKEATQKVNQHKLINENDRDQEYKSQMNLYMFFLNIILDRYFRPENQRELKLNYGTAPIRGDEFGS